MKTALILAGGFGTRLKERVNNLPKPMAPVAGRPFLDYLFENLITASIETVILSVGYLHNKIIDHYGNHYKGLKLIYKIENEPLGTGGAIAFALKDYSEEACFVLNGDSFLKLNYSDLILYYNQYQEDLMMCLRKVENAERYGSVEEKNGRLLKFNNKGLIGAGYINAGIYIIKPKILNSYNLPDIFSFETDFLQKFAPEFMPLCYKSEAYFIDIGVPEDYDRAQIDFKGV